MASSKRKKPSDLPTNVVRAPDGRIVRMKVVEAESKTLSADLLAAFSSNVRRVRRENKQAAQ